MKITIINGPNLNLLGTREPEVYGSETFEDYHKTLQSSFPELELDYYQSNIEGELIDKLQAIGFSDDAILINPGGYTHTSVALRDCISAIKTPVLEIHISNINSREEFRKTSITADACIGAISGLGLNGYKLGIEHLIDLLKK